MTLIARLTRRHTVRHSKQIGLFEKAYSHINSLFFSCFLEATHDYVELRDGLFATSSLLGTRYSGTPSIPQIISTKNFLWIKFRSDSSQVTSGFSLNYQRV